MEECRGESILPARKRRVGRLQSAERYPGRKEKKRGDGKVQAERREDRKKKKKNKEHEVV